MLTRTNEIRFETSTACNYHCVMCARDELVRKKMVMTDALFYALVDQVNAELPYIRFISIGGFGELFTDKNWKNKIEYAHKHFDRIHVISNFSLIRKNDLDFLLEQVNDIRISFYGLDEETYCKVHNPRTPVDYTEIMNNIMYNSAWDSGFRCLSTISKNNRLVMRSHSSNKAMRILTKLDDDYLLVEFNKPKNNSQL